MMPTTMPKPALSIPNVPTSTMINMSVALIAMAMTTTITMITMKADRAEANANPVAVIRRKSTLC
jgi:hypothetical protein